jgi:hypothetical protein
MNWEEFAIKHSWKIMKNCKSIRPYLPHAEMNLGKYPNRLFYWGILFTLENKWANEYFDKVMEVRMRREPSNLNKAKTITITKDWMDRLLKFDYKSSCKYLTNITSYTIISCLIISH